MQIKAFSKKQREIFSFIKSDDYALICDGSVRSGKTTVMTLAFLLWAMYNFNHTNFAICGKTTQSAERNVLKPLMELEGLPFRLSYKVSTRILTVQCDDHVNWFYLFGGKDESSYMLIQGITLAGVLFDEVALMPQSFVEQALSRAISYENSKYFFNCNPESPNHYFYQEWIEEPKPNTRHIHFCLEDNPILTETTIERTKAMYSGVFYDRYIRGLWVAAEGLIYPMFTSDKIEPDADLVYRKYMISMDYGTRNPTAMILWGLCNGVWYGFKEYYFNSRAEMAQKTDQEYYDDLCKFAGDLPIDHIIIDPSALSFITLVEKNHRFKVWDADNDVLDGIRHTAQCISDGTIRICAACENAIKEFGLYSWDEDATDDRPIKENDHAMDAVRYFVQTTDIWNKKSGKTLF